MCCVYHNQRVGNNKVGTRRQVPEAAAHFHSSHGACWSALTFASVSHQWPVCWSFYVPNSAMGNTGVHAGHPRRDPLLPSTHQAFQSRVRPSSWNVYRTVFNSLFLRHFTTTSKMTFIVDKVKTKHDMHVKYNQRVDSGPQASWISPLYSED